MTVELRDSVDISTVRPACVAELVVTYSICWNADVAPTFRKTLLPSVVCPNSVLLSDFATDLRLNMSSIPMIAP